MQKYKTILFDIDQTLLDFKKTQEVSLKKTFEKYNIPSTFIKPYHELSHLYWRYAEENIIKIDFIKHHRFDNILDMANIDANKIEVSHYFNSCIATNLFLMDDMFLVLDDLINKGYDLYLASNGYKDIQEQRIKSLNIKIFKNLYTSEGVGWSKPHVNFFDHIFKKEKLDKATTIMIGDNYTSDIKGAIDYGIDSIWINLKAQEVEKKPTYQVDSLKEILSIL